MRSDPVPSTLPTFSFQAPCPRSHSSSAGPMMMASSRFVHVTGASFLMTVGRRTSLRLCELMSPSALPKFMIAISIEP